MPHIFVLQGAFRKALQKNQLVKHRYLLETFLLFLSLLLPPALKLILGVSL